MVPQKREMKQVSQHALEIFEERNRAFRVLYDTIIELETCKNISPYVILARNLRKICRAELVSIGRIKEGERSLFLGAVVSASEEDAGVALPKPAVFTLPEDIIPLLKKTPLEACRDPGGCLCPEFLEMALNGRYAPETLSFYRFSCKSDEQLMAAGMIAADSSRKIKTRDIIEIYLNLAGMVIQRFHAVENIKESERTLKQILDSIPTGIMMIDGKEKRVLNANTAAKDMLACQGRDIAGALCTELFCLDSREGCPIMDEKMKMDFSERQLRKEGGEVIPILKSVVPVEMNGRNVFIESFIDISERKRSEAAIAEEKERLAVTLRSIGDGVITVNRRQEILLINKVAESMLGVRQPDVVGKIFDEMVCLLDSKTRNPIKGLMDRVVEKGDIIELREGLLVSSDGIQRLISDSVAPIRDIHSDIIGAVLVFRDISDKRKMEEELIKKQKLDSLGLLAGGIAHDFNNILAVIVTQVAIAKLNPELDEAVKQVLDDIEGEALRARTLTQQLMTFSKGGAPVKKLASLKDIIIESSKFALHGSNILCEFSIPDDLWVVEVDRGQINQVIQNIVLNAQQAMPDGGTIYVAGNNVSFPEPFQTLPAGAYVRLDISDSGEGIDPDIMEKIFDPYFTTKPSGTGLGLATVFSIVKRHGGLITVESEPEDGTLFSIYLPAYRHVNIEGSGEQAVSALYGQEKILLMDDEDALRDSMANLLTSYGYDVHTVSNGEDAIQKFQKEKIGKRPFDLVILDLTIKGGLGGKETVRKLRDLCSEVKIFAASGYSQDPILANYQDYGFNGIIAKPFTMDELIHTIRSSS